jgi:cytidylate kinase
LAAALTIEIIPGPEQSAIIVDGEDVTCRLRTPENSLAASQVSAYPGVRAALFSLQRDMGEKGEVVAEGRDMGTVVFPDAGLKFFLLAAPIARAKRRHAELIAKGIEAREEDVLADQLQRDAADENRALAPLKAAPDALSLDSTNLTVDEVLQIMIRAFRNCFLGGAA